MSPVVDSSASSAPVERAAALGTTCPKCDGRLFTEEGDPETGSIMTPCPLCFDDPRRLEKERWMGGVL